MLPPVAACAGRQPGTEALAASLCAVASQNTAAAPLAMHTQILKAMSPLCCLQGLLPYYISTQDGALMNNAITFGAMGDSYYEYLVKVHKLLYRNTKQ